VALFYGRVTSPTRSWRRSGSGRLAPGPGHKYGGRQIAAGGGAAADLKSICRTETLEAARERLAGFEDKWGGNYPTIGQSWRRDWEKIVLFLAYYAKERMPQRGWQMVLNQFAIIFQDRLRIAVWT